jgi:hypothetical protein
MKGRIFHDLFEGGWETEMLNNAISQFRNILQMLYKGEKEAEIN